MIPRTVFDCMVFLQAAGRPTGPAAACLDLISSRHIVLCSSAAILAEVAHVLSRSKIVAKNPNLTSERVAEFLTAVRDRSLYFEEVPRLFPYSRDPQDEPYLDLAIHANAQFLVSWDDDLLSLMGQANPESTNLRAIAPNLKIVTPPQLLHHARSTSPNQ